MVGASGVRALHGACSGAFSGTAAPAPENHRRKKAAGRPAAVSPCPARKPVPLHSAVVGTCGRDAACWRVKCSRNESVAGEKANNAASSCSLCAGGCWVLWEISLWELAGLIPVFLPIPVLLMASSRRGGNLIVGIGHATTKNAAG